MYGTVARFRAKPGTAEAMAALDEHYMSNPPPGYISHFTFQMDDDSNEYFMAVMFESREAYDANAASPEQNEQYLKWRELLEADPEWHNGQIVFPVS